MDEKAVETMRRFAQTYTTESQEISVDVHSKEEGYDMHFVTVTPYDGRTLTGFVFKRSIKDCYTEEEETLPWHAPSRRYLDIILRGQQQRCLWEAAPILMIISSVAKRFRSLAELSANAHFFERKSVSI